MRIPEVRKFFEIQNGIHILVKLQTELSDDEVRKKIAKKSVQINFLSGTTLFERDAAGRVVRVTMAYV